MKLPIFLYGSKVLRESAKEVDPADKDHITGLIADMEETLASADGCGLAAPQVGVSARVLIVDGRELTDAYPYLKDFKRIMINPVLLEESEETETFQEGCLSLPNLHLDVVRPAKIKVRYYDENFELKEEAFDRFACRMVQHEMDHLDGVLYTSKCKDLKNE